MVLLLLVSFGLRAHSFKDVNKALFIEKYESLFNEKISFDVWKMLGESHICHADCHVRCKMIPQ